MRISWQPELRLPVRFFRCLSYANVTHKNSSSKVLAGKGSLGFLEVVVVVVVAVAAAAVVVVVVVGVFGTLPSCKPQ